MLAPIDRLDSLFAAAGGAGVLIMVCEPSRHFEGKVYLRIAAPNGLRACWHLHRDFIRAFLFDYDGGWFTTELETYTTKNFERDYPPTGDFVWPGNTVAYRLECRCERRG